MKQHGALSVETVLSIGLFILFISGMTAIGDLIQTRVGSEISLRNQAFKRSQQPLHQGPRTDEKVYKTGETLSGWLSPCLRAWFFTKPYSVRVIVRSEYGSALTAGLDDSSREHQLTLLRDDWTELNSILLGLWAARCGSEAE